MKNDLLDRFTGYFVGCLCVFFAANSVAIELTEAELQPSVLSAKQHELLVSQLQKEDTIRVIVELNLATNHGASALQSDSEGATTETSAEAQEQANEQFALQAIASAQANLQATLNQSGAVLKHSFTHMPLVVYDIDTKALSVLEKSSQVKSIQIDQIRQPSLAQSTDIIGTENAYEIGATGAGQTVAVLDSGVESDHPF